MRPRWEVLAEKARSHGAGYGVEVGVFMGQNASNLLDLCPDLTLFLVDPWKEHESDSPFELSGGVSFTDPEKWTQDRWDTSYVECMRRLERFGERTRFMRMDSQQAARELSAWSFGFVFIDADHTEAAISRDLDAWWPLVTNGGFLSGHDYAHPNPLWGVKPAVDRFAYQHDLDLILGDDMTWFISKPS